MKKHLFTSLLIGAMLLTIIPEAGYAQANTAPSFNREEGHRTAADVVAREEALVPPAIIKYLLPGKGLISGLVWNDLNDNDVPDSDENGIANVRVYVDADHNAVYSIGDPAVLTDTGGEYAFPRIRPGTKNIYLDVASLPEGFEPTTSPYPLAVDLAPSQVVDNAIIGVQDLSGEISGTLWDQTDNVPISGVTVFLEVDNVSATGDPRSVSTDGTGAFRFPQVRGDDYLVYVDIVSLGDTYLNTPVEGSDPTLVTIPPGGSQIVDFAYIHQATISGVVRDTDGNPMAYVTLFIDLNGNGVYDAGEPLVMSDQYGNYLFDQLAPGAYTVLILAERLPVGYEALVSPGTITVAAGEDFTTADCTTLAQPVTISGLVWDDENGNAVREPGENGLAGVAVFLDANNDGIMDAGETSVTTDGSGAFAFTGLKHGAYYVRPDGSTFLEAYNATTQPNPVYWELAPGQAYDQARFGYQSKLVLAHTMRDPTRFSWGGDGNLYVADQANNSVFILDGGLNLLGELKGLAQPQGVAADGNGNMYVANQGRNNVEVYSATGSYLKTLGGSIGQPVDLALDRPGNIYVLDGANQTVLVFDQAGTLQSAIGDSLLIKHGVSLDIGYRDDGSGTEIGELYVADQQACTIHVFALDGTYKRSLGTCGTMYTTIWDGMFSGLMAVSLDPFGNVHGLDNSLNVVQVFSPQTGAFLGSYNAYSPENEYRLNLQTDIGIHPTDHRVLVSNVATRAVETITTVPAP